MAGSLLPFGTDRYERRDISSFIYEPMMEDGGEVLKVGVPPDRCPVFYRDADTGEISGIGVDLMCSAAKEAGYGVAFKIIEEATLMDAPDSADYDVIMPFGSAVHRASGQRSVVSENFIQTPFTLVTDDSRSEGMPPLNEIRVGMLRSLAGAMESVRALYPGIDITLYESMSDCVKALRGGGVDALLHNSGPGNP